MDQQNLSLEVSNWLKAGKSQEEVFSELLSQGHTVAEIQQALSAAKLKAVLPEETQQTTVRAITFLGTLMLGIGIFAFIAANWDGLTSSIKLLILLLSIVAFHVAGVIAEDRKRPIIAEASFFVGTIMFGASIFLVAQNAALRINWPDGLLLWMFGVLALGFARTSYLQYFAAIVLGVIAAIGILFNFVDYPYGWDWQSASLVLLAVGTALTGYLGWVQRKNILAKQPSIY